MRIHWRRMLGVTIVSKVFSTEIDQSIIVASVRCDKNNGTFPIVFPASAFIPMVPTPIILNSCMMEAFKRK